MGRNGRGLDKDTVPEFLWKDWGNSWICLCNLACDTAESRTETKFALPMRLACSVFFYISICFRFEYNFIYRYVSGLNTISVLYCIYIYTSIHTGICGPGSSVGIATGYGLDGPGIEKKNPGGARFSAPVQTGQTGPGAHQPSEQWVPCLFRG
jgi:hypothetical protein